MADYIFISYDAVQEFAADRFYQSAEFEQSRILCSILRSKSEDWEHRRIYLKKDKKGFFFYTEKMDRKRGVLFDLTTFKGFADKNDTIIVNIFQKVMKYGIKYFNGLPLVSCERNISDSLALVYPFPFVPQKDVDKVYIDKNTSSQNRANQNYLTVFHYGTGESMVPSFTNLNKAVKELKNGTFLTSTPAIQEGINSLNVTQLDQNNRVLTIDERVGIGIWMKYLTEKQLEFVKRDIVGAERLEGAAGTGKTISMVLRCIYLLTQNKSIPREFHIIFITHSIASKERTIETFKANCSEADKYLETDEGKPQKSILITTLQEWSGKNLGTNSIRDAEYLDKDAADSKIYQYLYIQQAISEVMRTKWNGYSVLCSEDLKRFMAVSTEEAKTEMFRYEISVLIKGRSEGKFDKYNALQRPKLCLPLKTEEDRMFAFDVFESYQRSLEAIGQFDSDDITLSALGQLNTPIWRRRSIRDGYDVCFIDETQLFNLNELSVFHYLNKPDCISRIIYAIDKSQVFGEVGFTEEELSLLLNKEDLNIESSFSTIFRSSPEIVDLAFNILSANTAIFHNFDNPVEHCSYSFTTEDEAKCETPEYILCQTDEKIICDVLERAEKFHNERKVERGRILIVSTSQELTKQIVSGSTTPTRSMLLLKSKNDMKTVQNALNSHCFVLGDIDFVGGLEFDAVFIVGVDKGRVPPEGKEASDFLKYAWHNRMYVAVTRAKYAVKLWGNVNKGDSPVLQSAITMGLLKRLEK